MGVGGLVRGTSLAYKKKKSCKSKTYRTSLRRERDSNPRYLSVRRFSRPVHSTTLPSLQMLSERFRERLSELRVQRYTYFFFCASFSCDFFENGVKKFVFGRCGCLKWCMIRFVLSVDGADNVLQERECFCC